jgi:Arc/MetJ-type ribon-helix-helix transcriptional regulator
MGVIHVQLPDELETLIDRQVADGMVGSTSEFIVEAARRFVEVLIAENESADIAEGADAASAAARHISKPEDGQILHERTMALLNDRLAAYRRVGRHEIHGVPVS